MNERVVQIRTDSLVAEYIYTVKLNYIKIITIVINVLTITVPIIVTSALLVTKGTNYENQLNILSIIISSLLLSLTILALIFQVEQKKENYIIARRLNIFVSNESLKNIEEKDLNLTWFYSYLVEIDSKDKENIGNVSKKLKQKAYRDSLEKLFPGKNDTVCSICLASPFKYKKGSCQVCGNTPKEI